MKIGVFSDSHDHIENIRKAIDIFLKENVQKIIHCGDLISPFIKNAMNALNGTNIEAIGVFGNNDGEREGWPKLFGNAIIIKGDFHEVIWNEKKIAIYHGTNQKILDNLIKSQQYHLVCSGHTHHIKIEKYGNTILLNPGEVCGYITNRATCAIVDLSPKNLTIDAIELKDI